MDTSQSHYVFDKVYGESHDLNSQQEEIYNDIGAEMLAALLNDRHCAFMAYGETGSGKTLTCVKSVFTVTNAYHRFSVTGEPHARGVLPRFCEALFDELNDAIASGEATVHLSYCEIYQEQVYDLLSAWADVRKPALKVRAFYFRRVIHINCFRCNSSTDARR